MAAVVLPTAGAAAAASASAAAAAATAQPSIARAATTTLASKLLGQLQNRTNEAELEAAMATATAAATATATAAAAADVAYVRGEGSESDGVVGSSTPSNYLSLYDEVASALDETQAAEEAGYALIDDISEWLLSAAGGNNLSLSAVGGGGGETTPAPVSSSSSGSPNDTLSWLTLDMVDMQNTTLASSSSGGKNSSSVGDGDGEGGLYALRNFVEQQLNGDASQDAQDIALIDSAEESALENVGDGETDYGLLSSFGGVSLDTDVDAAASDLLQRTATRLRNRTTAAAAAAAGYDADALWLSGGGAGAQAAREGAAAAAGAGGAAGAAARASADLRGAHVEGGGAGGGAGNGGSSFMLLLENFNDYFPNYNGSTVSGTTVGTSTASSILLDQNLTSLYIENYRNNCTNGTLNMTTDSCNELRVGEYGLGCRIEISLLFLAPLKSTLSSQEGFSVLSSLEKKIA